MGCDFDIKIQVRYGSQWVTVVWMYLKTPCGGHPISRAFWQLAMNEGNRGKYGTEYAEPTNADVVYTLWDASDRSCVLIGKDAKVTPKRDGEDYGDEDGDDFYPSFQYLYYSRDDAVKLAEVCGPTIHLFTKEKDNTDKEILARIPAYMDQAWSALPHSEQLEDWICGEGLKTIPNLLAKNTLARKNKLMRVLMLLFRRTVLNPSLIAIIADYALPRGEDVRLAISDEEGAAAAIRDGAQGRV